MANERINLIKTETTNEELLDAILRHQIYVLRVAGSFRDEVLSFLDSTEQDIADRISGRLASVSGGASLTNLKKANDLIKLIQEIRRDAWKSADQSLLANMKELAKAESSFMGRIVEILLPIQVELSLPSAKLINSIVRQKPFDGRTLKQWIERASLADQTRIAQQITLGVAQGERTSDIVRRVLGSESTRGVDGVFQTTRREVETIVRTAASSITNQVRSEFFAENSDVFTEEAWVATLDPRTCLRCMALDGQRFKTGEGLIPPAHMNCRCARVAVIGDELIGSRPTKAGTERELLDEFTSRNGLSRSSSRAALPTGFKGKYDQFSRGRLREIVGRAPASLTYNDWLRKQSNTFQNEVLGKTRAKLFRDGKLNVDKFVNRRGDELTLRQLASRDADAFLKAGLNPKDF